MHHSKASFALLIFLAANALAQQPDSASPGLNVDRSVWNQQSRQSRDSDLPPGTDPQNQLFLPFLGHLAQDQKQFWTAPARLHRRDLKWILPAAGATAGLFAADSWISRQVPDSPSQLNRSKKISDYGLYSLIGAGGGSQLTARDPDR